MSTSRAVVVIVVAMHGKILHCPGAAYSTLLFSHIYKPSPPQLARGALSILRNGQWSVHVDVLPLGAGVACATSFKRGYATVSPLVRAIPRFGGKGPCIEAARTLYTVTIRFY
jgi:hypothetical protein